MFLNRISAPSSISRVEDWYGLSRSSKWKQMWDAKNLDVLRKSKPAGRHEGSKNMSPQKNYKLKPILITLKTTFWSIGHVLFEVWCNLKYYFIILAALRPALCFSSSTFIYHFECSFLEQWNISKTYETVSTSWLASDALI